MDREDIVFVYGTLLRGEYNHYILNNAGFLGETETRAIFKLYDLGSFPAMVAGGFTGIKGEIYSVTPNILNQLDSLEGHPNWYERIIVDLDSKIKAYAYMMPEKFVRGRPEITSGDWRNR